MSDSKHPHWHVPSGKPILPLKLHNSLTNNKEQFITIDEAQRQVSWYICGPTVYDSAHLGHARAYVTFDILRRVMEDYFGYEINFVMNITDIDDKIILRARQNHLFQQFLDQTIQNLNNLSVADVLKRVEQAYQYAQDKLQNEQKNLEEKLPQTKAKDVDDMKNRISATVIKLQNLVNSRNKSEKLAQQLQQLQSLPLSTQTDSVRSYLQSAQGVLSQQLDAELGQGSFEQEVFRRHAAYYEKEFLEDMHALGVRDPTVLTRVTEYVEQIKTYIQGIIDKGFAYESNGSVYFDTIKFSANHDYAKLSPQSRGNLELAEEGEGALSSGGSEKRNPSDFALWKKSKPGEPSWPSTWGGGRPGWHIECSVMASDYFGQQMDIHAGGVDLKFPHHDNELAQAEAHYDCHQWVNYFLHAGHLNIDGAKMSKSLKNFVSIRGVLESYSARQIRFWFLSQPWHLSMNYSDESMQDAKSKERTLKEFFLNTRVAIRNQALDLPQSWNEADRELNRTLQDTQNRVHAALLDNISYHTALVLIMELINKTNVYLRNNQAQLKVFILQRVVSYVHRMMSAFGIISRNDSSMSENESVQDREAVLAPVLNVVSGFRDQIRRAAQEKKEPREILGLCDVLRDDILPHLGVRLEDKSGGAAAVWKLEEAKVLLEERAAKQAAALAAREQKLRNGLKLKQDKLKKLQDATFTVRQRLEKEGFTQFDAQDVPTHDTTGAPMSQNALKKLSKKIAEYKAAYDGFQAKSAENLATIEELKRQMEEDEKLLAELAPAAK